MKSQIALTTLALMIAGGTRAHADPVLDWNAISTQAILTGGRPGASAILDFAVVQIAVHDAVQAYDKRFEPYAVNVADASGSMAAAVAKVTRDVVVNRFPAKLTEINNLYEAYLADRGIPQNDPGVQVGQQVAAAIIALRANDGSFPAVPPPDFFGSNEPGKWRPTPSFLPGPPPSFAPMAFPWAATVTPFSVNSAKQFHPPPPPSLKTKKYADDYNEVKALGHLNSTARTPEQTQLAYFWADNFLAQVNRLLRGIAETYLEENSGDIARLFALAWITGGDGLITTWAAKLHYANWRPLSAIQDAANDGNPDTVADPAWQPFLNTPNYPDQSSGANALIGGVLRVLALYFGTDEVEFIITSNNANANPNVRHYSRFSEAADQVVEVRILHGIHFRFADKDGRDVGEDVAKWVVRHTLRPLHK